MTRELQITVRGERTDDGGYRGAIAIPTRSGNVVVTAELPAGATAAACRALARIGRVEPGEVGVLPLVAAAASYGLRRFGPRILRGIGRWFGRRARRAAAAAAAALRARIARAAQARLTALRRAAQARLAALPAGARGALVAAYQRQVGSVRMAARAALAQVPARARAYAVRVVSAQIPPGLASAPAPLVFSAAAVRQAMRDPARAEALSAALGALGTVLHAADVARRQGATGVAGTLDATASVLDATAGELAGVPLARATMARARTSPDAMVRRAVQLAEQLAGV
jgi:hypothetical protein